MIEVVLLCFAQTETNYFYRDVDYGSDSQFNPFTVLINNGFDILRQPSYNSNPFELDWGTAFGNVFNNLARPDQSIEKIGYGDFVNSEIFPYKNVSVKGTQYIPNYALHLFGEGMVTRKLSEWYRARGVPVPYLMGALTNFAAQLINEAAENGSYVGANWDPIADIYIFDILGHILFSFDLVAEFFSGPLRINYWPHQAAIDVVNGNLFNLGENYGFKLTLGPWTEWRVFGYLGNKGLLGLSIPVTEVDCLSIGFGVGLVELIPEYKNGVRVVVPGTDYKNYELGFYWDRGESLLASLSIGGMGNPRVQLNVYPGFVRMAGFSLGAYFLGGRYEGYGGGLTISYAPINVGTLVHQNDDLVHF
jgi:hypothetical protein